MTEAFAGAGRLGLSGPDPDAECEAVLVDRLIDLLLALEPFEIKQSAVAAGDAASELASDGTSDGASDRTGEGAGAEDRVAAGTATSIPDAAATAPEPAPEPGHVPAGDAATLSVESTRAMLVRMRAVLDREAARLGEDGLEGKAAVDQVALIARTLEKIDQMERLIAEDQARAASGRLGAEEREQLRLTVRQLILSAAERMAADRAAGPDQAAGAEQAQS
ncbi:hypothetical protein [Hoeflea sp.]|uniref:hypothetical protein n=1 Tax=Hoeflea sp. TaxID=1940281 RepID=UPI003A94745F